MGKYIIGDVVKIKNNLAGICRKLDREDKYNPGVDSGGEMESLSGLYATITGADYRGRYNIDIDNGRFLWIDEFLEEYEGIDAEVAEDSDINNLLGICGSVYDGQG